MLLSYFWENSPSNPPLFFLKRLKNEVFQLFFRLVHWNCLTFGTKVNLNTYTLVILKLFGKILIPLIPLNPLENQKFKVSRDNN